MKRQLEQPSATRTATRAVAGLAQHPSACQPRAGSPRPGPQPGPHGDGGRALERRALGAVAARAQQLQVLGRGGAAQRERDHVVVLEVEVAAALDAAAAVAAPDVETNLARNRLARGTPLRSWCRAAWARSSLRCLRRSRSTTRAITSCAVRPSSSHRRSRYHHRWRPSAPIRATGCSRWSRSSSARTVRPGGARRPAARP